MPSFSASGLISIGKSEFARFYETVKQRAGPCIVIGCLDNPLRSPVLTNAIALRIQGNGIVYLLSPDAASILRRHAADTEIFAWGGAVRILGSNSESSVFNWLFSPTRIRTMKSAEAVDAVVGKFEQCMEWERRKKFHALNEALKPEQVPRFIVDTIPSLKTAPASRKIQVRNTVKQSNASDSVAGVLQEVSEHCPHLIFPPSAYNSAALSPYRNTRRLHSVFLSMESVASQWEKAEGKTGRGWRHMFQERGVDYRSGISDGTLSSYSADYTFRYEGKPVVCAEHITLGVGMSAADCMSIHWYKDAERFRLFVPHVGRHMRCLTTN